jgi:rRNA maturation protein Nop10
MPLLKKCNKCSKYTLKEYCKICGEKTKDAHYKFIRLKDVKENLKK